jgi:multiple sugar transport system ATP-binding protein
MNFVPGVLKGTAEQMTLDAGSLQVAFSPQRSQHLAAQAGTEVQLGIRPEDIYASDLVPAHVNGAQVAAHVDVTEMLGSETLLHIDIDQHRLLAKVDPRTRARAGEALQVTLDVDRLHLFDAQTEKAIDKIEVPAELREAAAARLPTLAPEVVSPA